MLEILILTPFLHVTKCVWGAYAADAIEKAVSDVLKAGFCTPDIAIARSGARVVRTYEMGTAIAEALRAS